MTGRLRRWLRAAATAVLVAALPTPAAVATELAVSPTLLKVRQRGSLLCGVGEGTPGFSTVGPRGKIMGLEVDFCAALASAVLGAAEKVETVPLAGARSLKALRDGEIDVLVRSNVWSLSRETGTGLSFSATLFHDGQAIMVRRAQGVGSVLELSGASICALAGDNSADSVRLYFANRKMRVELVSTETWSKAIEAYQMKRCVGLAAAASTLAAERARLKGAADHVLLPERLSDEPLGPLVRRGDEGWRAIVAWTVHALVAAERLGLTRASVAGAATSPHPEVLQFVGAEGRLGAALGLDAKWAMRIVRDVGNYGEIYARHLGSETPIRLPRGRNAPAGEGGVMVAPLFR